MIADRDYSPSVEDAPVSTPRAAELPPRLRLLWVGPEEPSWVSLTLQLDAQGCWEPRFRWVSTSHEALAVLRDESFDCVLLGGNSAAADETRYDPLSLLSAIRASGCDDPVILVATHVDDRQWAEVCQFDCEVLVTPRLWESVAMGPLLKRAIQRVELSRENHRLAFANHRRLLRERDEADHLLRQQRQIVSELEALAESTAQQRDHDSHSEPATNAAETGFTSPRHSLPPEINDHYHELLRTYVIMGSGNLGGEIANLAKLLAAAGLSPRQALELHLQRVETVVRGLGNRSTRHVMARADLLALELMIHLGEHYQRDATAAASIRMVIEDPASGPR